MRNEAALAIPPEAVTIELDGCAYAGTYRAGRGFVTLTSEWGTSYAQRGRFSAEHVAAVLLRALVKAAQASSSAEESRA